MTEPTAPAPRRVLFVCVENSNRSQMAEAFARIHGAGRVEAYSAGSRPSGRVNPKAIESMREIGYDLGGHILFANRFELDAQGALKGFKLRIRGQKERIVSGFHSAGFRVAAVGDSLNDLSLLKSCDYPVLFRPVEALRVEFPDAPVARDLDEALAHLEAAWRRDVERDGGSPS